MAYNAHNGGLGDTAVGKWAKKNWEYVAAGAMVIGGAALMFVPGGQTVGMGLISAGVDTAIQKATTGHVNWGEVLVSGVAGGVSMGAGTLLAKGGATALKVAVTTGAIEGAINGGGMYMTGRPDPPQHADRVVFVRSALLPPVDMIRSSRGRRVAT